MLGHMLMHPSLREHYAKPGAPQGQVLLLGFNLNL